MSIYKLSSVKELMESIDPSKPLYVDTETAKLGSDIRLVQVFQEGWKHVLELDLQPHYLIGHNFTYDLGCFKKDLPEGVFEMPRDWDDTFYLSRLTFPELNTGKGFSLDSALSYVLGYDPYAKEGLNKHQLQMSFERIKVKDNYIEGPEGLKQFMACS